MTKIPRTWTTAPLGTLCNLVNGRAFRPAEWTDRGLPIIRIQNLNRANAPFNHFDGEIATKHLVQTGDVLFAWSGTPNTSFGAHYWNRGDAVLNQHIYKLEYDRSSLDGKFLVLAINQQLDKLIQKAHGAAGLRHITKSVVQETEIAIAPLGEQKRIVARMTGLLDRINDARSAVESILLLSRQYHQSIVNAAHQGHLTSTAVGNQGSAWGSELLGNILDEGPLNGWSPKSGADATGALTLRLSATSSGNLRIDDTTVKRIYVTPEDNSKYWLMSGDVLVQRANSLRYLGATAIYSGPNHRYIYPDLMMRIRISDITLRRFVWRYLNSSEARTFFRERATGTTGSMPKINRKTLTSLPIRLPPRMTMTHICDAIDRHSQSIAYLEEECTIALSYS